MSHCFRALLLTGSIVMGLGTPVNLSYDVPFRFTGQIVKVTVDLE